MLFADCWHSKRWESEQFSSWRFRYRLNAQANLREARRVGKKLNYTAERYQISANLASNSFGKYHLNFVKFNRLANFALHGKFLFAL